MLQPPCYSFVQTAQMRWWWKQIITAVIDLRAARARTFIESQKWYVDRAFASMN
jgi:hypothetical protein